MSRIIKRFGTMFIIDEESNKNLDNITLLLTIKELKQLQGYIDQLLEIPPKSDHYHLSTNDYQKEITICLYTPENTDQFNQLIKNIISNS